MSDVKHEISPDGNTLILKVDISPKARAGAVLSNSGKMNTLATTGGFTKLAGDVGVSLNVTVPVREDQLEASQAKQVAFLQAKAAAAAIKQPAK